MVSYHIVDILEIAGRLDRRCFPWAPRRGECYPTERKLRAGDVVQFDGSAIYREYVSDIGRTCVVIRPSAEQARYFDAVATAGRAAVEMVRPGVTTAEDYHTAQQVPRDLGIQDVRHHVRHEIELEHEGPRFGPRTQEKLAENMVLCVEVPSYVLGLWGFHAERAIRLTADGHEYLCWPSEDLPSV